MIEVVQSIQSSIEIVGKTRKLSKKVRNLLSITQ